MNEDFIPRSRRQFVVEIMHSAERPSDFDYLFAQYLTEPTNPFLSDYAPMASTETGGGYDGPFVLDVAVHVEDRGERFYLAGWSWDLHHHEELLRDYRIAREAGAVGEALALAARLFPELA